VQAKINLLHASERVASLLSASESGTIDEITPNLSAIDREVDRRLMEAQVREELASPQAATGGDDYVDAARRSQALKEIQTLYATWDCPRFRGLSPTRESQMGGQSQTSGQSQRRVYAKDQTKEENR